MDLNVGILGGGNISQTHQRAALEIDGVNVTAVCGQNARKTAALAQAAGVPAYQDLDAFLSHRPMDAVLIGSPSGLHAQHGIAAAKCGLHVLVEKPIDMHEIEVEDTVVSSLEFASGAIGSLEAATSAYPGFSRRIEMTWSQGTVVLENDRIHSANLFTPIDDLCGDQPTADDERATSAVVSDTRGHRAIIEDFVQAIVSDRVPLCDGHQARRSVELVRAIYESSRTGQAVRISDRNILGKRSGSVANNL